MEGGWRKRGTPLEKAPTRSGWPLPLHKPTALPQAGLEAELWHAPLTWGINAPGSPPVNSTSHQPPATTPPATKPPALSHLHQPPGSSTQPPATSPPTPGLGWCGCQSGQLLFANRRVVRTGREWSQIILQVVRSCLKGLPESFPRASREKIMAASLAFVGGSALGGRRAGPHIGGHGACFNRRAPHILEQMHLAGRSDSRSRTRRSTQLGRGQSQSLEPPTPPGVQCRGGHTQSRCDRRAPSCALSGFRLRSGGRVLLRPTGRRWP